MSDRRRSRWACNSSHVTQGSAPSTRSSLERGFTTAWRRSCLPTAPSEPLASSYATSIRAPRRSTASSARSWQPPTLSHRLLGRVDHLAAGQHHAVLALGFHAAALELLLI